MKYDPNTRQLFTGDGKLIKKLQCPLKKTWENLLKIESQDLKRRCNACQKDVLDISSYSEDQVVTIVQYDPDVCVCIRNDSRTIQWDDSKRYQPCIHVNIRIIQTARSEEAINLAAQDGFMVLLKKIEDNPEIRSKIGVFQDKESQRVEFTSDYRYYEGEEAIGFFYYDPNERVLPVAAYLVPKDIQVGEIVYIPDLIENIVASKWNQGDACRKKSARATWNGEDFDIVQEPIRFSVG